MKIGFLFRISICLLVIVVGTGVVYSKNLGTLKGVLKPKMIKVYDNELFVVEGHKIFVYSLKDLSLKMEIGKQGEGPGEYKLDPSRTLILSVVPEYIIAESRFKVVYFSRKGKYVKEFKKTNFSTLQILPFGKNFLVYKYYSTDGENNRTFFSLCIYDKEMKEIKELHRQKFFSYEDKAFVMPDGINYCIHQNLVFVEKGVDGFIIDIYDSSGKKISGINKPYDKIKVSEAAKKAAYADYINIPSFKRMKKERGAAGLQSLLDSLKFEYPKYYPPIKDIAVNGDTLYVRTSKIKEGREEYLLMNYKGKILKRVYLPIPEKVEFLVKLQGDKKYYNIYQGKYYYLKLVANDDDEDWQLFVENIN